MCSSNISFGTDNSPAIFTEKDTCIEFHFIEAERVYNSNNMCCIYIVFPWYALHLYWFPIIYCITKITKDLMPLYFRCQPQEAAFWKSSFLSWSYHDHAYHDYYHYYISIRNKNKNISENGVRRTKVHFVELCGHCPLKRQDRNNHRHQSFNHPQTWMTKQQQRGSRQHRTQ